MESVITFGPDQSLVGVISEPSELSRQRPIVLMWNVGLNHRVGPSRCWVDLARRLATHDIAALRFDLGGLGDSAPRSSPSDDIERAILDLNDAMAALEERGWNRFILVSNCSGTDVSHPIATRDPRVCGAVYLDGYTYATHTSRLIRRVGVVFSKNRWQRWMRVKWPALFEIPAGAPQAGARDEIYNRIYPPREVFERDLSTMVDRGVRLLFIYSGEQSYAYDNQFWDWLERKEWNGRIELEYYPNAGHVYPELRTRHRMISRVEGFIVRVCG